MFTRRMFLATLAALPFTRAIRTPMLPSPVRYDARAVCLYWRGVRVVGFA